MIWYGQCGYIITITYQDWHILTSGLVKNWSKKQTMCSYPLFLASSTRDVRCSKHTAMIITNDICLAIKSHTPSFLSAVLTAAFVTSTSIRSMHSCKCLGFKCCCVGCETCEILLKHTSFTHANLQELPSWQQSSCQPTQERKLHSLSGELASYCNNYHFWQLWSALQVKRLVHITWAVFDLIYIQCPTISSSWLSASTRSCAPASVASRSAFSCVYGCHTYIRNNDHDNTNYIIEAYIATQGIQKQLEDVVLF